MRYVFEPYTSTSKITCPNCGKRKQFTRLVDTTTGELLPLPYGACSRAIKCGWMKFPKRNEEIETTGEKIALKEKSDKYDTLPYEVVEESLKKCIFEDNLSVYLISLFGEKAKETLLKYKVGCNDFFGGKSTIFYQISKEGECRSGKVIKYTAKGKRIKEPYPKITWLHSKIEGFQLKQCLFGEYLLNKYTDKDICFTESEKSAIICSMVYPNYLWLAGGQLHSLQQERLSSLNSRNVIFYPDKSAYNIWNNKLQRLNLPFSWKISNFLENTDLKDGLDIADWVLMNNSTVTNFEI